MSRPRRTPARSPRTSHRAPVVALLAVLLAAPAADASAPPQAEPPAESAGERLDRRVATFFAEYQAAVDAWEQGGGRSGPHPAGRFLPRMETLVEAGFDGGRLWVLEHLDRSALAPSERDERRQRIYTECFGGDPDDPQLEGVALDLAKHPEVVDPLRAESWCRSVLARTKRPEIQAAAMLALAGQLAPPSRPLDPGRANEARELLSALQQSHAGTRAARAGRLALFHLLDRRYAADCAAWRQRFSPGEVLEELPEHPAVSYWRPMEALARAGLGRATWWLVLEAPDAGFQPDHVRSLRLELLEQLVARHGSEPWVAEAVRESENLAAALGLEATRDLYRKLLENSTNPEVRAWTLYGLASLGVDHAASEERVLASIGYLVRLQEQYPQHRLSRSADGLLFGLRHLRVGCSPPDWEALDGEERPLRLFDFRGRVTVVVFWSWASGSSRELLPRLVELSERHAGGPFAVVGVNTDSDPEAARARAVEEGLSWRNVYEGSAGGAWTQAWGVRAFPRVLVLDADGVVRASDPGAGLEAVVDGLVEALAAQEPDAGEAPGGGMEAGVPPLD